MKQTRSTQPKVKRIPRPIIAIAAPSADTPTVTIDRLKGGEINWTLKVPGPTIGTAITRAINEARRLMEECMALETLERDERARVKQVAAVLAASLAAREKEKKPEEGGGK